MTSTYSFAEALRMANYATLKGIVLADGAGACLHPATLGISKQLLPIYDKPMIYYPLATLMLAGVRDILLMATAEDLPLYQRLLGDGNQWGISLSYATQPRGAGRTQALMAGRHFIGSDRVALVLGDNIFYGHGLAEQLRAAARYTVGATVFTYRVRDPGSEAQPSDRDARFAMTGLYFYDDQVLDIAASLGSAAEIADINRIYLERGLLRVELLGRGVAWLDTGTHASLLHAAEFMEMIETRQGLKVCCPEEIAFRCGYIDAEQLDRLAGALAKTRYGAYLTEIARQPF